MHERWLVNGGQSEDRNGSLESLSDIGLPEMLPPPVQLRTGGGSPEEGL